MGVTVAANGIGSASSISAGKIYIIYKESADDFVINSPRSINPHYLKNLTDDVFFDLAGQGKH
ncbi:hypothetical protein [Aliivibrio sifiae]|uniref:Uncharacterized protein n=1 Tax=Aliivibrio sifiae TaxID=566293 RepID=A0A2S7X2J0_9GAMM|nr:hypothetical protein [Aliivibrio sifiae]PQJ84392.1 hypothetical protein BTO22_12700 [Aliivibrio sifiae]